MMPWQPVIDGDVIPARPIDRIAAGAGAGIDLMVGTNTDEHRLFLVPSGAIDQVTDEALAGAVAAYGLPVEATLAAYRAAHPGRQRRRPARGHPDRLVLAHPRHPPGRRPRDERLGHLHVRVRLALAAVRRAPRRVPCARDPLRLRHARQRDRAAAGEPTPPQQLADTHARRLGGVRDQWRPRLAEVRSQPQGDHALRYDIRGRGRSSIRERALWKGVR